MKSHVFNLITTKTLPVQGVGQQQNMLRTIMKNTVQKNKQTLKLMCHKRLLNLSPVFSVSA